MIYYVQTTDDNYVVRIPSNEGMGDVQVVPLWETPLGHFHTFNLSNPLKTAAMREARAAAKRAGLRLKHPQVVAAATTDRIERSIEERSAEQAAYTAWADSLR